MDGETHERCPLRVGDAVLREADGADHLEHIAREAGDREGEGARDQRGGEAQADALGAIRAEGDRGTDARERRDDEGHVGAGEHAQHGEEEHRRQRPADQICPVEHADVLAEALKHPCEREARKRERDRAGRDTRPPPPRRLMGGDRSPAGWPKR